MATDPLRLVGARSTATDGECTELFIRKSRFLVSKATGIEYAIIVSGANARNAWGRVEHMQA